MNQDRKEEIAELTKYLEYTSDSMSIFMPNEIFKELQDCSLIKSWQHIAYCYTFYYLISYLYRNCVFGTTTELDKFSLTNSQKKVMKYASSNIRYLTKKGGVLDELGYTETTTNYPIKPELDDWGIEKSYIVIVGFLCLYDLKEGFEPGEFKIVLQNAGVSPNFKCKKPIKGFYRLNEEQEEYEGTFFSASETHFIPIDNFIKIMSNENLGYKGFYLYGYFRRQTDKFPTGFNASLERISRETGIGSDTITKYIKELEKEQLLEVIRYEDNTLANTYKANVIKPGEKGDRP